MYIKGLSKKNALVGVAAVAAMTILVFVVLVMSDKLSVGDKTTIGGAPTPFIAQSYSRVSLFNAQKARVSLAIPDYWEGNYRVKESGGTANFYFIAQGQETKMFALHLDSAAPSEIGDNKTALGEKSGFTLSYELFAMDGQDQDQLLRQMAKDREEVVKSFRIN